MAFAHPLTRSDSTLFWLASAAFASMASMRICDPMLPALGADFGVPATEAAGVVTTYTIGYGVAQLAHGPLGDRIGKVRYIAGAALVAAAASLVCALAPGLKSLELARLMTGAIAAAIIPLSMAWIGDTVPYAQRQPTLAKFLNGTILGLVLGQAMGGLLADTLGWRAAFALLTIIFAVAGWNLSRVARAAGASTTSSVVAADVAGSAATFQPEPSNGQASAAQSRVAAVTATLAGRYATVLRSRWARVILVIVGIEGLLAFGAFAFAPTLLQQQAGLPAWLAGVVVAAFGLGGLIYTANTTRLVRALGETGLSGLGGVVIAAGLVMLAMWPGTASGVAACILIGLGYHMLHNTLQTNATQMAPAVRGTAVAMFAMSLFFGQSLGVWLAAASVERTGFAPLFVAAAAGLVLLGAVFAALLRKRMRTATTHEA